MHFVKLKYILLAPLAFYYLVNSYGIFGNVNDVHMCRVCGHSNESVWRWRRRRHNGAIGRNLWMSKIWTFHLILRRRFRRERGLIQTVHLHVNVLSGGKSLEPYHKICGFLHMSTVVAFRRNSEPIGPEDYRFSARSNDVLIWIKFFLLFGSYCIGFVRQLIWFGAISFVDEIYMQIKYINYIIEISNLGICI